MSLRHFAHQFLPKFIVRLIQKRNKKKRKLRIQQQAKSGGINLKQLEHSFRSFGIQTGDVLMVHTSLSKIGYVDGGAKTLVKSLLNTVGASGHLLMPTSSNAGRQIDFIQKNPVFDVLKTPSAMGAASEYFRQLPQAKRSLHPTESVACIGPNAADFVREHFQAITPYNTNSPFSKVIEKNGKILMIGVTLDNAGTHVHCLEDATDFPFKVYAPQIFEVEIIDDQGQSYRVKTKVHNPEFSAKRYCDFLIPIFEKEGILTKHQIGAAQCLLIDAKGMFESLQNQLKLGRTIYGSVKKNF